MLLDKKIFTGGPTAFSDRRKISGSGEITINQPVIYFMT